MKTKKSIWRKIKGKWVNLSEISKAKDKVKFISCDEDAQTNYYSRTNIRSKIAPTRGGTKSKKI
tara:strand:- start:2302 stop:2493 length:192 start_codon:yes stop_codon:yes gene_type:complete